jgi:hypothetical protein
VTSNRIGLAPALIGGVLFLAGAYFVLAPPSAPSHASLAAQAPPAEPQPASAEARSSWVAPKTNANINAAPLNVIKANSASATRLKSAKPAGTTQTTAVRASNSAKPKVASPRAKSKTTAKALAGKSSR